jgi:hypothetical protein
VIEQLQNIVEILVLTKRYLHSRYSRDLVLFYSKPPRKSKKLTLSFHLLYIVPYLPGLTDLLTKLLRGNNQQAISRERESNIRVTKIASLACHSHKFVPSA